ncbi:MAG: PIG-L family deacetylase [Rubrivivax sp.]|nr:PIG-L family deacetylase [Rubrivivax sp.]
MNRSIRAEGTSEAAWRPWLRLQPFVQQSLGSLMSGARRLVVVAPHPDDEVLGCGGLLAMQAEQAAPTLVVGVTDGEKSHGDEAGFDQRALAAQRAAERLEGARQLGLSGATVVTLKLPDAALAAHIDDLVARLESMLQPTDLVVSTWRHDGHPDHDACGLAAARASKRVGCRHLEAPVWLWNWARPGDSFVPWHRMVALPLSARALAAKHHALQAHASQLVPRSAWVGPVLGLEIRACAARPCEYFFQHEP